MKGNNSGDSIAFDARLGQHSVAGAMLLSPLFHFDQGPGQDRIITDAGAQGPAEQPPDPDRHDVSAALGSHTKFLMALHCVLSSPASQSGGLAVHLIDLNRFKKINQILGRDGGDFVLATILERLRKTAGPSDLVAHLGGDKFIAVQANTGTKASAEQFARRLGAALSAPVRFGARSGAVTVSIGIALAQETGIEPELILRSADFALERAMKDRSCFCVFSSLADVRLKDRVEIEGLVSEAVLCDGFILHYQPLFEVGSRALTGFEALIRLPRKDGTLVSPAVFIPIAEEMGLIGRIGQWVLRTACREAMRWPDHLSVAVNLSPGQFADGSIVEILHATLEESGLEARRLELEITERQLLHESESTLADLLRIKAMGINIAMDDFGTGYSSLNYLWRFPFSRIKIDRSFVQDFDRPGCDVEIVLESIIRLCKRLQMRVTVEGVETATQAALVRAVGGDEVQGFFFGRPVPEDGIAEIISANFQRSKARSAARAPALGSRRVA
jgi:diguanylate cyclase (GGDEF)-like protein